MRRGSHSLIRRLANPLLTDFDNLVGDLSILVVIQMVSTEFNIYAVQQVNKGLTLFKCGLGNMGDIFQVKSFHREHEVNMWFIHQQDQVESFRVDARQVAEVLVSRPRSARAGS